MGDVDSVLAGADVAEFQLTVLWPWRLPQRGFFVERFLNDLSGVTGSGTRLYFWIRENQDAEPDQELY